MARSKLRGLSTAALVVTVAAIVLLTLTPVGDGDGGCPLGLPCAAGHFLLFAILGVALTARYATSDAARRSPRRVLLMAVLAVWIFAAADELAQAPIEHRSAELVDWLADMAGTLVGMLAGSAILRRMVAR